MDTLDLFQLTVIYTSKGIVANSYSSLLLIVLVAIFIIILLFKNGKYFLSFLKNNQMDLVKLNITFGKIGSVEFKPNTIDVQIAHKLWTELVTRKAAVEVNPDEDLIVEVYNSWYKLFQTIRVLISDVPAELIKKNESTKKIVDIAIKSLNCGLRPHLTKWQGKFNHWYNLKEKNNINLTPQEIQKEYPAYNELIIELKEVNIQMIEYAKELKKIINQ